MFACVLQEALPTGTRESYSLVDLPPLWVVVLVFLPLIVGLVSLAYGREELSLPRRATLAGLRALALGLLLLVLARPVQVEHRERVTAPSVLVLVDDSASMRREDSYRGDDATRGAVRDLTGRDPEDTPRSEIARAAYERVLAPRLERGGYDTHLYAFDAEATLVEPGPERPLADELKARGAATHLGDAIAGALAAQRGRYLTDVVVLSDGRSNGGLPVEEAARAAEAAGVAVHTLVIGDTRPEKNAVLELVEAPQSALEGDELSFTVRVSGRGGAAGEAVRLSLEELDASPEFAGEPGVLTDERSVVLEAEGARLVLVAPPAPGDARSGERRFRLSLPPLEGETLVDDNQVDVVVRVSPEKVRVLYVEGYPRWEYRRLALDLLERAERDIEFQAYLASATPGFPHEHSLTLPSLTRPPTSRADLLENYDVVILGDVNPYQLFDDPAEGESFLRSVREFVEAGGGLLFQAGERDNPRAFLGTPLEDLLPIQLDAAAEFGFDGEGLESFRGRLEEPTAPHPIVRLDPDFETNRRLWEEAGGLRGFYWYSPVTRAKPGAEVLLRHPTDENRFGRRPLIVAGYYPEGRTLFLGVDSTWRWQNPFGARYFERFWKGAIRWLALGRLRGGDRRYRLETARSVVDIGERVTLEARILGPDYRPSEEPTQEVRFAGPDGTEGDLTLDAIPDRPGTFRGGLEAERPGSWSVWIEAGGQRLASAEFEVVLPSQENSIPAPDPLTLTELAARTGGASVELTALEELAAEFQGGEERREPISSKLQDLWDSWTTLLLVLLVLGLEWGLRKAWELV
jgi:uncharacterized membrane protein